MKRFKLKTKRMMTIDPIKLSVIKPMLMLSLFLVTCSDNINGKETGSENAPQKHNTEAPVILHLNNGNKWKADANTIKNVDALADVVKDQDNLNPDNKVDFTNQLSASVDSLIRQCRMQGPDHDALHLWLNQVLKDVRELEKNDKQGYQNACDTLRKDIMSFYQFFE